MDIHKTINFCNQCDHSNDHSGAFTPGGALPLCTHRESGKRQIKINPLDAPVDVLVKAGMSISNANKLLNMDRGSKRRILDEMILGKVYPLHWIHRVIDRNKEPPAWCPLLNGSNY